MDLNIWVQILEYIIKRIHLHEVNDKRSVVPTQKQLHIQACASLNQTTSHISCPPFHGRDKSHSLAVESFESTPKPRATRCIEKRFFFLFFFFSFYSVSLYTRAVAQHVWQACRAQPPKSSALLFHRQAIITAVRLGRLVNLNLGITLWHQGEEDVLCCVVCLYIGAGIKHLPQRGAVVVLLLLL